MKDILRGEIHYCKLPKREEKSNVQTGIRPCIIISNNANNRFSGIIKVMPITSKIKKLNLPCHVLIEADVFNGLTVDSMAMAEQVVTIEKDYVLEKIGRISKNLENQIYYADMVQNGNIREKYSEISSNFLEKCFAIINSGQTEKAMELLNMV